MYFVTLQYQSNQHVDIHDISCVYAVDSKYAAKEIVNVIAHKAWYLNIFDVQINKWIKVYNREFPTHEKENTYVSCWYYPGLIKHIGYVRELYNNVKDTFEEPDVVYGLGIRNGIVEVK